MKIKKLTDLTGTALGTNRGASLSMSGARVLCFVVLIDSPFIRVIRAILLTADSEGLFELTGRRGRFALKNLMDAACVF